MSLCLGIESSCDETAAAVVKDGREVLSSVIASSAELHKVYGGVVPEIASRRHIELILPVVDQALKEAGAGLDDIALIAATQGPGLVGSLLVGLMAAKALAFARRDPFHRGKPHRRSYLRQLSGPFRASTAPICLTVSGGHTELLYIEDFGSYKRLGRTRDDAAGECLDKVGRMLGLPYPAGPVIDRLAMQGDPKAYTLPRGLAGEESLDFSFSGLKTAALNEINRAETTWGRDRCHRLCRILDGGRR